MKRSILSWGVYAAFVSVALALNWHSQILVFDGYVGAAKATIWALLFSFAAYSFHCSQHENLFKTIRKMNSLYWGRQIGIDLYIGATIFMAFIYLHEGSFGIAALWLLPTLLFVNLATLLYLAIHLESIIDRFTT